MAQRGYFAEFFFLCGLCASVRNFSRRRSRAARHFWAIAHFNCKDFFSERHRDHEKTRGRWRQEERGRAKRQDKRQGLPHRTGVGRTRNSYRDRLSNSRRSSLPAFLCPTECAPCGSPVCSGCRSARLIGHPGAAALQPFTPAARRRIFAASGVLIPAWRGRVGEALR